jgi:hypothetical protein
MSWGDGQYIDYCFNIRRKISKKKLDGEDRRIYLDKRWKYVCRNTNLEKKIF